MKKIWKIVFWGLMIGFAFHLIRDVMQLLGWHNWMTDFWHKERLWCGSLLTCEGMGMASEILVIVGSGIVLKRRKMGILGVVVLVSLVFWPVMLLLP